VDFPSTLPYDARSTFDAELPFVITVVAVGPWDLINDDVEFTSGDVELGSNVGCPGFPGDTNNSRPEFMSVVVFKVPKSDADV
jgi:hypothetical protein